ncbi:MAG: TetR family transcriptional regulator [Acidocella sp. 20-57-95]|nr:MAG: TetR family transcriptional regulator [Acidocella sp. 20-57-95]OYV62541.1 MAG: TetR family transcriptional regulator [Acidocella sp. 21-58-7]HQT63877.1 TetR/AcrR family transcriptional regulator [Acidocella sp.]HQU03077.1 TetR/AcrR family transcriptional regulator [Acidocella sp.]
MKPTDSVTDSKADSDARPVRSRDPERTKQDILDVATMEFAAHGLAGGRVDAIAAKTQTTKRMIYYYFESKENLYALVLERAYAGIRRIEEHMDLDRLDPETALRRLVEFTFDYHDAHPEFVRLVAIENIHNAAHVKASRAVRETNRPALMVVKNLLSRGLQAGVFKRNLDPVDLHLMISAMCYYRVSNRQTFGTIFECDLNEPKLRERQRRMITDAVALFMMSAD